MSSLRPPMHRRGRLLAAILGGIVLLAGCGQGTPAPAGAASAAEELHRAAQTTLSAKSFVIHITFTKGLPGQVTTTVYQAPDRVHTSGGANTPEMIAIGHTTYTRMAFPPTPDGSELPDAIKKSTEFFQRFEAPASDVSPTEGSLAQVHALADAPQVERDGSGFRWRAGSGRSAVSGNANIANGRIASFAFEPETPEWSGGAVTYRFSDYDAAPAVDPPPAERIADAPAVSPCGPDGYPPAGQTICGGGVDLGGPTISTTITLQAPTVTGRSPLELRRVMAVEKEPCSAVTGAYGAGEVRLDGPEGCYRLGTVLATIRQAKARPESGPSGVTVSIDISQSDRAAVRSALSSQFQRQVAMVMFGRVLSSPIVQDLEPSLESIAVSPVDPQTAANIIRALGN